MGIYIENKKNKNSNRFLTVYYINEYIPCSLVRRTRYAASGKPQPNRCDGKRSKNRSDKSHIGKIYYINIPEFIVHIDVLALIDTHTHTHFI